MPKQWPDGVLGEGERADNNREERGKVSIQMCPEQENREKNKYLKMLRGTAKAQRARLQRQTGKYVTARCRCSTGSRPAGRGRMCKTIPATSCGVFCSSGITVDTTMCYMRSPTFPVPSPDNTVHGFIGLFRNTEFSSFPRIQV